MDGASNENGSGASMMPISPEGHKIHCALRYGFLASNNEFEYEALIVGLCLTRELQARNLKIYSDSQLVLNQVNDIYLTRGERTAADLEKAKKLMGTFPITSVKVILRSKNANANALAKLASTRDVELLDVVSMEFLIRQRPEVMELVQKPSRMNPIIAYLKNGMLPEGKTEARILRLKAALYVLYDDKLYRRGYSMPLLKCVPPS